MKTDLKNISFNADDVCSLILSVAGCKEAINQFELIARILNKSDNKHNISIYSNATYTDWEKDYNNKMMEQWRCKHEKVSEI